MRLKYTLLAGAALGAPAAQAAEMTLSIEIPTLPVAEYHRPYVAIWIAQADQQFVDNLAVWYDLKMKDNEGTKWLKDLRQWWRRSGRELSFPVDGVSSATRAPGEHLVRSSDAKGGPLSKLAPGSYQIVVEAAREVGGRELLRVPFTWPASSSQSAQARGEHELGKVVLNLAP